MTQDDFDVLYDELAQAWSEDCEANGFSVPYPPRKGGRTDRLMTMATNRILAAWEGGQIRSHALQGE